jgi:integrase
MWVEKNGRTWRIRDNVGGRRVDIGAGYPTKTSAKAAMVQLQSDAIRGDALVPRGGRMLFVQWVDDWWPAYASTLKPSAAYSEGSRVRIHIRPMLGHLELDEITGFTVQQWLALLAAGSEGRKPIAPKTIRNVHGLLHKILQAAVVERLIRSNPCASSRLPRRVHHEMRFLTAPEIERLLNSIPEHWRPIVLLLVSTGLRWGEAAGLKVGRLDLLAGRLTVLETLHELPTGEVVFTSPKSERSRRTVTFPRSVAAELAALVVDKDRNDLVFTAPLGGPPRTRNFRRTWLTATKAAGVSGLRVHDLRHTHAALLISAGRPLTAISRRLGHASISVTSDLYGHLLPEVDEGIITAIENVIDFRGQVGESDRIEADATRRTRNESAGQTVSRPS